MAIAFRGSVTGSAVSGNNITLTLSGISGIQTGDQVIIIAGSFPRSGNEARIGNALGFTQLVDQVSGTTNRTRVARKTYDSTTDGSVTVEGSANAADGMTAVAFVFSGVDQTTPIDVTTAVTTGSSTNPNCLAITPASNDCAIIAAACSAVVDASPGTVTNFTQPSPFTVTANDTNDTTSAMSYRLLTGGASVAQDPAPYSSWSTAAWVAATLALRPAAATVHDRSTLFSASGTMATTATKFRAVTTAFTAAGSMSSSAVVLKLRTATFSAVGSMSSSATRTMPRTATFAGVGTMSSLATLIKHRTMAVSAVGSMASVASKVINRATLFNAAGSMISAATKIYHRTALFAAVGTMASAASRIFNKTTTFNAAGSMSSAATIITPGVIARSSTFAAITSMSTQAILIPRPAILGVYPTHDPGYESQIGVWRVKSKGRTGKPYRIFN